ncbi:MAG: inositol monophosphatase [Acidimicrobiia bacterium]|nr:inositol monophosphatase [Acidimicrobiia bacterium]
MNDLDELLATAAEAARIAAAHTLERLERPIDIATKSSANDFVTQVDQECEQLIVEHILGERPDDAIVGEEGAAHSGSSGVRWHIDPIDGTTNFVYGQPGYSVSIGAEVDGIAVVGAVVDPMHGDTFTARRGGGAFWNGRSMTPRGSADLASAIIATGFAYDADRRRRQATVLVGVLEAVGNLRRVGSAATDLCWVACGRLDGYYEVGLNSWDYTAGVVIAAEAGARVHDLRGDPPSPTFVVAAAPGVHDALVELLVGLDADGRNSP